MANNDESPSEQLVAGQVEAAMRALGSELGQRERHDARPGMLRIDFRYPEARPPVVLEVTTIDHAAHRSGTSAADKLMRRLSAVAEREELGAWLVAVETTGSLRQLEGEILDVVREESVRPAREYRRLGRYTSEDLTALPSDEARAQFVKNERRRRELGIVEVNRVKAPSRPHVIGVLPMTGMRTIGSFADWLQDAIDDNAAKLGEVEGHERHLGVLVVRFDASTFPTETPVPALPPEIETLWIVHG